MKLEPIMMIHGGSIIGRNPDVDEPACSAPPPICTGKPKTTKEQG
jgi:hypothetical protein